MISLKQLTPAKLRIILISSLALIIGVAVVIFYFANTGLKEVATTTSHKIADAEASRSNLDNLKKIQDFLAKQQTTIDRVNSIVADSKSYQYQDQIIIDLNAYAAKAGIVVTSINFSASAASAAPASTTQTTTPAVTAPAGGVKSVSVSVSVASPVDYESLLKFVKSIEQNLTKMQISSISLSKGEGNQVTTDALNIEVFIR